MRSRRIQIVTKMIYMIQPETVKRRKPVSLCLDSDVMLSRWGRGGGGGGTQKTVKTVLFQLKGVRLSDGRGDGTEDMVLRILT